MKNSTLIVRLYDGIEQTVKKIRVCEGGLIISIKTQKGITFVPVKNIRAK